MEIGEKRKRDSTTTDNLENNEERASKLSRVNKTVIPFDFIECECEYTIIASDKHIKLPTDFMKLACVNLSDIPKEIDLSTVTEKDVIDALSFYVPRSNRYFTKFKLF